MAEWGFTYKTNLIWFKTRKDGGPDGRGVGFYFRNVTEVLLFGIKGKNNRTLAAGRRQVNLVATQKRDFRRPGGASGARTLPHPSSGGRPGIQTLNPLDWQNALRSAGRGALKARSSPAGCRSISRQWRACRRSSSFPAMPGVQPCWMNSR